MEYVGFNVISGRYGPDPGEIGEMRIDSSTNALTTISYPHHEIHEGKSFVCHYSQTVSDTDDKSIIAFKVGAIPLDVVYSASASSVGIAYIYESPAVTDGQGTTLAVYNRNRQENMPASTIINTSTTPDTAGSAMYFSETDMAQVAGGTQLAHIPIGASAVPKPVGGTARETQEWILRPGLFYAFIIKSTSDADNTHWLELSWYEHTDKR